MAKKALLIGVNRYKIPGADLRGCVNDVKNLQAALVDLYGFAKNNIKVLTDSRATQRNIVAAVRALVSGAGKGDVILVHFSGHGSNVPDNDGDEADQRDEILCPTDLDWKSPLRDDWLRKTFDRLKRGVSLTVITDCCHSGTITRVLQPPDAPVLSRYLPSPWDLVAAESGRRLRGKVTGGLRGSSRAQRSKSDIVHADIPEVLITGCRDTQTSADAMIGGDFNGALTYNLVQALRQGDSSMTYRDLHGQVTAGLRKGKFDQVPQLEGHRDHFDRPFLSPID
jgi:metacaspase-1